MGSQTSIIKTEGRFDKYRNIINKDQTRLSKQSNHHRHRSAIMRVLAGDLENETECLQKGVRLGLTLTVRKLLFNLGYFLLAGALSVTNSHSDQ